jgi:hypothetical protein
VAHQEIILLPFEVRGYTLNPVQPELWTRLDRLPRSALSAQELEYHIPRPSGSA